VGNRMPRYGTQTPGVGKQRAGVFRTLALFRPKGFFEYRCALVVWLNRWMAIPNCGRSEFRWRAGFSPKVSSSIA
jgi:hypothetical protein